MQFAICIWDFEPAQKTIDDWRAQGVTALEPGAVFLTTHSKAEIAAVGRMCRDAGIRIYACHPPFGGEYDLSLLDEEARHKAVSTITASLRYAAMLGAECAVIHPASGRMPPQERAARTSQLMRSLEALLPVAQENGVRLALENMLPHHLGDHSADLWSLAEQFDTGICLDVGHAHITEEGLMPTLAALRERIITFHLQDNDHNADRHIQPPYGTIDWPPLVRELTTGPFDFPWSVETAPWDGASYRLLLDEMEALFTRGLLTIPLGGSMVNVVCEQCGRYAFGTLDDWSCGCTDTGARG